MKAKALILGDIRFQYKYGFYFIYLIFTILYIILLHTLPFNWRRQTAILMIFSDPAAMGLFFMGAIVLFEKGERVLNSIAVSPVHPIEYTLSKLISIALISTIVGLLIGVYGGIEIYNISFFIGLFLGSCMFSAVGLIVAMNISTLNQFIVATIPAEIIINIPALAYLFGWNYKFLIFHPGVCIIELLKSGESTIAAALILIVWTVNSVFFAQRTVEKSFESLGGIKL